MWDFPGVMVRKDKFRETNDMFLLTKECPPTTFSVLFSANTFVEKYLFCRMKYQYHFYNYLLVEDQLSPFVFLVFVRLFLCSPIHLFKRLIILNVTYRPTLTGNINIFIRMLVSRTLCKVADFCHWIGREEYQLSPSC